MAEYIDREEYCEKYCRCSNEYCDKESCPIWKAPAADVAPVVRCKDCKQYRVYMGRDMCAKDAVVIAGNEVGLRATAKDNFCSYGERKNGGAE